MESKIIRELTILPSLCDDTARLGIPQTFALFMDAATEHAQHLGLGAQEMMARGLFWLTTKTMVRFHRRPGMAEHVTLTTWPEKPGRIRCNRFYTLTSGEELLVEGKTEWAVIEMESGKLCPVSDIYPEELEILADTVCEGAFARVREDFSDGETYGAYRVCSTDIDLGGHMNNAAYVRALIGMFSTQELKDLAISELDVTFRASCYEGEMLTVRTRTGERGMELGMFRPDGKAALLVQLR